MKGLLLLIICHHTISTITSTSFKFQEEGIEADVCTPDICKVEEGCRCESFLSPLPANEQAPQLVCLTFDGPQTELFLETYWKPLFYGRLNPDKQQIGGTFFVSHEYTDYQVVNDLYSHGFEIGVNAITNPALQAYWLIASAEILEMEFGGQRRILNKFANIPEDDIIGARTPQLQLAGNNSFAAYQAAGLQYDSSWPTMPDKPLFPYTLDYLSSQQCLLAQRCPNESFRGFWVLPINDIVGYDNRECNNFAACNITGSADEISKWLLAEINKIREGTRIPLTLVIETYWFDFTENSLEGLSMFLDKLAEYDDVFLVSQKQVLDWMRNPVPLSEFRTDHSHRNATCKPYNCGKLKKPDGYERYLNSCFPCPANYPWLGNPDGN